MKSLVGNTVLVAAILLNGLAVPAQSLTWSKLPSLPDKEGFAGAFAGVAGEALLVAGGANITGDKYADAFQKTWYDSVFVLEQPDGAWKRAGKLPRPLGYGASITTDRGVVCIGGSDSKQHYADVFRLKWSEGRLNTTSLPPLPKPCANACGALIGNTIYIAGGIETPTATTALKTFWKFDLANFQARWTELEPWPGPERMLAVAGAQDGSFFLFSGAKLNAEPGGKPVREFLRDAYRFTPGQGWKRLPDLPRATVAAASPAPSVNGSLLILSGDDGKNVDFKPLPQHPGFPREVLAFDVNRNTWSVAGEVPFSRATVPFVEWRGQFIVPSGEVRPRDRTPEVWWADSSGAAGVKELKAR